MAKKQDNTIIWIIGIAIIVVILLPKLDFSKFSFNIQNPQTPQPLNVQEYLTYDVSIGLNPTDICAGDFVTGTINSNIPNGVCSIFSDVGVGYSFLVNINLDYYGDWTGAYPVMSVGTANFMAVCCDAEGNCKLSNIVALTSRACDTDGDGIPDEIDLDDDNDGYTDEEEIAAGTNPKDPISHPSESGTDPCPVYCQGLGAYSTGSFVTSPGYCDSPEISFPYPIGGYCCCTPTSSPPSTTYTCGQGEDPQCGGTCPSDYSCLDVYTIDLYIYSCMCVNSNDEVHIDWKPTGLMFNEQGEYPEEEPNCIDSDGVNPFVFGTTTYLGISHPDVCHAGWGYAVDEYVCINDIAVKKEIQCPYEDCVNGKCTTGTTTIYNECLSLGYINGGSCIASSPPPTSCIVMPSLDTACGNLYPLNHAICCN